MQLENLARGKKWPGVLKKGATKKNADNLLTSRQEADFAASHVKFTILRNMVRWVDKSHPGLPEYLKRSCHGRSAKQAPQNEVSVGLSPASEYCGPYGARPQRIVPVL